MLTSYSNRSGILTSNCENTSGGVMIAARMKITTIECFLYFLMKAGVITPIFVRKNAMIGSSKTSPVARQIDVRVPIYDLTFIWLTTSSLILYVVRKCIERGASRK